MDRKHWITTRFLVNKKKYPCRLYLATYTLTLESLDFSILRADFYLFFHKHNFAAPLSKLS